MEASQPVATLPAAGARTPAARAVERLRVRVATTPGRLVLISVLLVVGAVAFGVSATLAERSRAQAAQAVRTQTEPLLVQAVKLYTALSDANATATTTFLTGGLEPPALRARYRGDLRLASDALAGLTREVGSSPAARAAVVAIGEQLPAYSGLVEAARANNRQGFPVGAAYLRKASTVLTGTVLAEADRLYEIEADRLSGDYATGTASASLIALVALVVVALAMLAVAQLYLARISRRILNLPMLGATVILAGVSIWAVVGLAGEQAALLRAQRRGSDPVELLSATRVLLSRAQSDESLTLVNRGSDETDPLDFAHVMRLLAPPAGLIGQVEMLGRRTGTGLDAPQLARDFAAYRSQTDRISALEGSAGIGDAVRLATSADSNATAQRLGADLTRQIGAAQRRFASAAADATASLAGLSIALPALTVLAAGLALVGIRQRLSEYR